jgi:hypothetical protein
MTLVEEAALELVALLDELNFQYMLIGGVAVALWGEPRATLDVDITILVEPDQLAPAAQPDMLVRFKRLLNNV